MRSPLLAVFLLAASAAAGCGSSAPASSEDGGAGSGIEGGSGSYGGRTPDGGFTRTDGGTSTTTNYEGRTVIVHVPLGYVHGTAVPLVVMLHGCTQTAADFETGTHMDAQADLAGFIVAYPEEPSSANSAECWNWFLPGDQARGSGEPQLLAHIVGDLGKDYSIDPGRVFAAGLSAGAAMAVIVGATYPDVFAAIGVSAGLEYEAATDESSAFTASASGGPSPTTQGDLAFTAMGAQARPVPVIVFHGDSDQVVNVANGSQVVSQWSETDARAQASVGPPVVSMGSAGGKSFTHTTYADGTSGKSLLELYIVHGMGHAWSGGSPAGSYTDPDAPDASAILWQFFSTRGV